MKHKTLLVLALLLFSACLTPMTVTSDPSGAAISVNGDYIGTTPVSARINTGGRVEYATVIAEMTDCEPQQRQVQLGGSRVNVHFVMGKDRRTNDQQQSQQQQMQGPTVVVTGGAGNSGVQVKEYGSVSITGTEGARIYLDGTLVGNVPVSNLRIESGTHTLEVTKVGWATWKESILVTPGSTVGFVADLVKQPRRP